MLVFRASAMDAKVFSEMFLHCPFRYLFTWRGDLSIRSARTSTDMCCSLQSLQIFSAIFCMSM